MQNGQTDPETVYGYRERGGLFVTKIKSKFVNTNFHLRKQKMKMNITFCGLRYLCLVKWEK